MDTPSTPHSAPTRPTSSRWWWRPLPLALIATALLLLLASGPFLLTWLNPSPPTTPAVGMPWQVQVDADGRSEVFGLRLGVTRLADVQTHFAADLSLAVVVSRDRAPTLEAYVESFRAGFITGKLVLAFDADAGWLERAPKRAVGHDVGEGGRSVRYKLSADAWTEVSSTRLIALSFVPSARLDEDVVQQRFGTPTERLSGPGGELQLLYPASGVAVALPPAQGEHARAKSLIQYVAPAQFETLLRAPLKAASAP